MDCAGFPEQNTDRNVCIVGSKLVENYTVYIIEVVVGDHRWTVDHRYSDFHDLHEKLTSEKKTDKHLLPPKKIIGKNSKSLVEKREKELEVYLQTLLSRFPVAVPKVLSVFLHFHFYEINGIAAKLAEDLFHRGEQLLAAGEVFVLKPLQLYAVTQQLKLAKPTCANGDAKADLGHILDFACRLKYLKIPGTKGAVGTSNIEEDSLPFDLSVFKSLLQIEMTNCSSGQIEGISSLKSTLATLTVHNSAASMKEILVPEAAEFAQWEPEGADVGCPVTAIIPTWRTLTTLDMSHNQIRCIDESVKLIPAVEFLDLGHNRLSLVENLQYLYNLVHLDLSWNKLTVLQGVHTKLGNIKTLNLSGNELETLSGLSKLYSLVNLDLSSNRLAQLDEMKHIGALPCLEKLSLTGNPMCIIPDYRTKVLARFGDRASEVCLDGTVTTQKELDTVEVLKAIQKAKEAKDRMATNERRVSVDPVHPDGGVNVSSSSSVSAAPPAAAPPAPAPHSSSSRSSQELANKEEAFSAKEILTHVDPTLTRRCFNPQTSADLCPQVKTSLTSCLSVKIPSEPNSVGCFFCENRESWTKRCSTPVLHSSYLSYSTADLDFIAQLSELIRRVGKTSLLEPGSDPVEVTGRGSPDSRGSYFEMGPDHSDEILTRPSPNQDTPDPRIHLLVWCYCMSVGRDEGLKQRTCCLAATGDALVLLQVPEDPPCNLEEIMKEDGVALVAPYSDIGAVRMDVPDTCVSFSSRSGDVTWFVFSDAQNLNAIRSHLDSLVGDARRKPGDPETVRIFLQHFLNSWEIDENETRHTRGRLAHVLNRASLISPTLDPKTDSVPPDVLSSTQDAPTSSSPSVPLLLFLAPRHLCILKLDFSAPPVTGLRSRARLTRIPLTSALLRPAVSRAARGGPDGHRFCQDHVLEIMAGPGRLAVVFALPQEKFQFLSEFTETRASLRDIKAVALMRQGRAGGAAQGEASTTHLSVHQEVQKPRLTLSLLYPSDSLVQQLSEENQCPSHLSLSSSLRYLSSLRGHQLVAFFHHDIAEVDNEELKHILWTSVLFYTSPDVEISACVMLSTKAVYFILDDAASTLGDPPAAWAWHPSELEESDFLVTFCFVMKLHELQCVNVGLFDQYFRLVGASPEHIVSCLTRESYSTHHFLQQLMSVLSLLEKAPSPEPSDQDFYTQFGKKGTGKMENYELLHSSRVKFMYPSEEEIGDLTFIAAERKGPQGASEPFRVLFYALAFQVQDGQGGGRPELRPKSLVLSGTHVFLLDEDYISYPLPQFAKEPPQRDKYGLTDARRIRDLDRVLMGYQPYPQALTLVFDDVPGPDLLCHLTVDHFSEEEPRTGGGADGAEGEVQWCVFVPGPDSRERLISLLARQWEALCSRELPLELTG